MTEKKKPADKVKETKKVVEKPPMKYTQEEIDIYDTFCRFFDIPGEDFDLMRGEGEAQ